MAIKRASILRTAIALVGATSLILAEGAAAQGIDYQTAPLQAGQPGRDSSRERQSGPVEFPIAYESSESSGAMVFVNEGLGLALMGNRNPDEWLLSAPPYMVQLSACEAAEYNCISGLPGFPPLVVGPLAPGEMYSFPDIDVAVRRTVKVVGACDEFRSAPLSPSHDTWSQTAINCPVLGVVQIELERSDESVARLNLKSAVGLFGSALIHLEPPLNQTP